MNAVEQAGHDAIREAVDGCAKPVIFVEMARQFGDVLHSTIVVRHLRKKRPGASIVWGIGEPYADAFDAFTPEHLGPHAIARLPKLPPRPYDRPHRVGWVRGAAKMNKVVRSFGCGVHPWGWKRGSIVTAVLDNAGIEALLVPRSPWLPLLEEDHAWGRSFVKKHDLKRGFVTLEYVSYSREQAHTKWFEDLARRLPVRCVSLAGAADPLVPGTVDGRGTSFPQAKELIRRSSCFVGSGSGLSVLATSNGCETPMVELVKPEISAVGCGYRESSARNLCLPNASPEACADAVMRMIAGDPPKRPTMRERALMHPRRVP